MTELQANRIFRAAMKANGLRRQNAANWMPTVQVSYDGGTATMDVSIYADGYEKTATPDKRWVLTTSTPNEAVMFVIKELNRIGELPEVKRTRPAEMDDAETDYFESTVKLKAAISEFVDSFNALY